MNVETATNAELDAKVVEIDAGHGAALLRDVHAFLGRFIAYPSPEAHVAHALWILHTHLMDRWESTPRLAFLSPEPGSGKSRALEVTKLLVPKPVAVVNVSPAYVIRKVADEDGPPTVLFDEVDATFGPKAKEHEDLRSLLNAGHHRGAVAGRCVIKGKTVETEELECFAAVALAGLGFLPDTIMTRSVIIRMRKRAPNEKVEQFRLRLCAGEGTQLFDRIEAWARQQTEEVDWSAVAIPDQVQDRDADVWESLLAVADMVGGKWPALARKAAISLVSDAKDIEPSLGVRLLEDIRAVFGADEKTPSVTLVANLLALGESPWNDLKGGPLNQSKLARRLRAYSIKPRTARTDDKTPRCYWRSDFEDMWKRHLPPLPEKAETSKTPQRPAPSTAPAAPVSDVSGVLPFPDKADRTCRQCNLNDGQTTAHDIGGSKIYLHHECAKFYRGG